MIPRKDREKVEQAIARGWSTTRIMADGWTYDTIQQVKAGMEDTPDVALRPRKPKTVPVGTCRDCGRRLSAWYREPVDGQVRRAGRELCARCKTRRQRATQARSEVDEVAVERLMYADPPTTVTRTDRMEAVRRLADRGLSYTEIAARLGIGDRLVARDIAALRERAA